MSTAAVAPAYPTHPVPHVVPVATLPPATTSWTCKECHSVNFNTRPADGCSTPICKQRVLHTKAAKADELLAHLQTARNDHATTALHAQQLQAALQHAQQHAQQLQTALDSAATADRGHCMELIAANAKATAADRRCRGLEEEGRRAKKHICRLQADLDRSQGACKAADKRAVAAAAVASQQTKAADRARKKSADASPSSSAAKQSEELGQAKQACGWLTRRVAELELCAEQTAEAHRAADEAAGACAAALHEELVELHVQTMAALDAEKRLVETHAAARRQAEVEVAAGRANVRAAQVAVAAAEALHRTVQSRAADGGAAAAVELQRVRECSVAEIARVAAAAQKKARAKTAARLKSRVKQDAVHAEAVGKLKAHHETVLGAVKAEQTVKIRRLAEGHIVMFAAAKAEHEETLRKQAAGHEAVLGVVAHKYERSQSMSRSFAEGLRTSSTSQKEAVEQRAAMHLVNEEMAAVAKVVAGRDVTNLTESRKVIHEAAKSIDGSMMATLHMILDLCGRAHTLLGLPPALSDDPHAQHAVHRAFPSAFVGYSAVNKCRAVRNAVRDLVQPRFLSMLTSVNYIDTQQRHLLAQLQDLLARGEAYAALDIIDRQLACAQRAVGDLSTATDLAATPVGDWAVAPPAPAAARAAPFTPATAAAVAAKAAKAEKAATTPAPTATAETAGAGTGAGRTATKTKGGKNKRRRRRKGR
jgi:hypothetical protein